MLGKNHYNYTIENPCKGDMGKVFSPIQNVWNKVLKTTNSLKILNKSVHASSLSRLCSLWVWYSLQTSTRGDKMGAVESHVTIFKFSSASNQ